MSTDLTLLLFFIPLFLVFWLAHRAERERQRETPTKAFAWGAYLLVALLWLAPLFGGLLVALIGMAAANQPLDAAQLQQFEGMGLNPEAGARLIQRLPAIGLALFAPALLGLLLLLPFVRKLLARLIPIDPANVVHAVALSCTMLVVANLWATLAFGLDTLADMMSAGEQLSSNTMITLTWFQEVLFFVTALFGVGWLARRSSQGTLARLGIVRPSPWQVGLGIGLGLGMAAALIPLEYLMSITGLGIDPDVARLSEQVIGPMMMTIPGILTLGLAAALGEEAIFRGAMQPRFGLILTSLLFALLHSNYGITLSTLIVFGIGLVLGWVRRRHNTSTSMIVHAVYNMTIGLLTLLNLWPEF